MNNLYPLFLPSPRLLIPRFLIRLCPLVPDPFICSPPYTLPLIRMFIVAFVCPSSLASSSARCLSLPLPLIPSSLCPLVPSFLFPLSSCPFPPAPHRKSGCAPSSICLRPPPTV